MDCNSCKQPLPDDASFCPHCRAILSPETIHRTAIDHKRHFLSRHYLKFLFFSCKGRINRERFITAHFFLLLCFIPWLIAAIAIASFIGHTGQSFSIGFQSLWIGIGLYAICVSLLCIPVYIKRAHDMDCSSHWCWLGLIPGLNILAFLWFVFKAGTKGINRHGFCPRGSDGLKAQQAPNDHHFDHEEDCDKIIKKSNVS